MSSRPLHATFLKRRHAFRPCPHGYPDTYACLLLGLFLTLASFLQPKYTSSYDARKHHLMLAQKPVLLLPPFSVRPLRHSAHPYQHHVCLFIIPTCMLTTVCSS